MSWNSILSSEQIITDEALLERTLQNTSAFKAPNVLAMLKPTSVEEVIEIVTKANLDKKPIYAYSRGNNWGLGSKLPHREGCTLVDLSGLNKIRKVDAHFRYAIVEPGVTQWDVYSYLKANQLPLMLNVTGSWQYSSVIGNMMERGSGFLRHRIEDLRGLEVILGTGKKIRTGFWNQGETERETLHFPYGVGPDLRGLFTQSNLGIVTGAVVNLYDKLEEIRMVWCKVNESELPLLVEILTSFYKRGYIQAVTHIGNDKRMKIENQNKEDVPVWTAMCKIMGNEGFLDFVSAELKAAFSKVSSSYGIFKESELPDENLKQIYNYHSGIPGDYFVRAMYQSVGQTAETHELDVDQGRYGMLCCLPIIPAKASDIQATVDILNEMGAKFGNIPAATLNPLNDLYLEAVINIYFDRRDEQEVEKAHIFNKALHEAFYSKGFRFYRFDVTLFKEYVKYGSEHWEVVADLKKVLDPNHIISPGRYNII